MKNLWQKLWVKVMAMAVRKLVGSDVPPSLLAEVIASTEANLRKVATRMRQIHRQREESNFSINRKFRRKIQAEIKRQKRAKKRLDLAQERHILRQRQEGNLHLIEELRNASFPNN